MTAEISISFIAAGFPQAFGIDLVQKHPVKFQNIS